MYVTPAQLAERPGALELAQVASTAHEAIVDAELMDATLRDADRSAWPADEIAAADEALVRVNEAIMQADALIDGYLAKRRYPLPLTPVPGVVTEWSRQIARYYLHKDAITDERTGPIARDYRDALRMLQLVADGKFSLGGNDPQTPAVERDVRYFGQPRKFTDDSLGDY